MDKQKLILSLVRRAGVTEESPDAPGIRSGRIILVLQGAHKSSLDIFDDHGKQIGAATRIRGRYSRDGHQYRYEVSVPEPKFVITDISKGRWISVPRDFTIAAVDGSHIAAAHRYSDKGQPVLKRSDRPSLPWESFAFERNDEPIASLWKTPRKELRSAQPPSRGSNPVALARRAYDRFLSSQLFYVEDHCDREVARITYLSGSGVGYVLDLQSGVPDLLSTIAVAACIIADNAFVSPPSGNGGGT